MFSTLLSLSLCLSAPPFEFPQPQVPPPPKPVVTPETVLNVPADQLLVITSEIASDIFVSPLKAAKVTHKTGPVEIFAKFYGGSGQYEAKTFTTKNVFIIQGTGGGAAEILMVQGNLPGLTVDRQAASFGGVSPSPDVPPGPPAPTPTTAPFAVPAPGQYVLITYNETDLPKIPLAQLAIINGQEFREFLQANNAGTYRIWDPSHIDVRGDIQAFQDAFKRPRSSSPWICVSNGKAGYEGPLPATVAEAKSLLQRIGK